MNKREAENIFNTDILPEIIRQYGKKDFPARSMAWNDYTDMLCKDGQITLKQYEIGIRQKLVKKGGIKNAKILYLQGWKNRSQYRK